MIRIARFCLRVLLLSLAAVVAGCEPAAPPEREPEETELFLYYARPFSAGEKVKWGEISARTVPDPDAMPKGALTEASVEIIVGRTLARDVKHDEFVLASHFIGGAVTPGRDPDPAPTRSADP